MLRIFSVSMLRILPAAIAALFFLVMTVLYVTGQRSLYEEIIRAWGVDPFRFPFVDTETVLSAVRCLKAGVDVIAGNPCDPIRRVFDYSPFWLLLAKLPVTDAWTMPAGFLVDVAFIASLLLLPAGRGAAQTGLIVLGVISSAVVFGVERANNDLVLFELAAVAAALACRSPLVRLVGYAAALLAGLLKYYPMSLLALTTRERPVRFFAIVAAVIGVLAWFLVTMGDDLSRALKLIPKGQLFGDMFGSTILPRGLATLLGWPGEAAVALRVALAIAVMGAGVAMGRRAAFTAALDRLTDRERTALLAGSVVIVGCFFTALNIGYRATFLLLTLPALTALWRLRAGRLWTAMTYAVLALLWAQGWRNVIALLTTSRPIIVSGWLVRETVWWLTIAMLIAIVSNLIARSEMGRRIPGLRINQDADDAGLRRARASASSTSTAF